MKYMNFLAGALGLMALAACNSVIEQPNALSTITVAYNQGPATRTTITPDPEESYPYHYAKDGIKVTWEPGDRIALIKDGTTYTYETDEEGEVATFTLVNGPAPTAEGDYKLVFPADWTGDLTDFATQDLGVKFNLQDYLYATGTAKLTDGAFEETVTLTPIFSFLYIPESTVFHNMHLLGFREDGYVDEDNLMTMTVDLSGTNLFDKIEDFEGTSAQNKQPIIHLNNFSINCPDSGSWSAATDYMIAIPVLEGKPVNDLNLSFDGSACFISTGDGSATLGIGTGGLIYRFAEDGHSLWFAVH